MELTTTTTSEIAELLKEVTAAQERISLAYESLGRLTAEGIAAIKAKLA